MKLRLYTKFSLPAEKYRAHRLSAD